MLTLVVSSILDYVHTTPFEFETVRKCDHPVAFVHMEIRAVNVVEICLVLCLSCEQKAKPDSTTMTSAQSVRETRLSHTTFK
jgi:hypothetical protein